MSDIFSRLHIITPYFRSFGVTSSYKVIEQPDLLFEPYQLYVITNRLSIYVNKFYPGHQITYIAVEYEGNMVLTVRLLFNGLEKDLSEDEISKIQKEVNKIVLSKHVIVFDCKQHVISKDDTHKLPEFWIRTMLNYVYLPDETLSYVEDDYLYAQIDDEAFTDVIFDIQKGIINQLQDLYQKGAYVTSPRFAKLWGLINASELIDELNANENDLYFANWRDERIAPYQPDFFASREKKSPIYIKLRNNWLTRHQIAEKVNNPIFDRSGVYIHVNNIEEALHISNIIFNAKTDVIGGKVAYARMSRDIKKEGTITYKFLNNIRPYIISKRIPLTELSSTQSKLLSLSIK